MADNYYYLIAGLPDLIAGDVKKGFSFETTINEVLEELTHGDAEQVKWLRYRYDNDNLISLISGSEKFDTRGYFSQEQLKDEYAQPEKLPSYMITFLDLQKEGKEVVPGFAIGEQLATLYYKELFTLQSTFLNNWATFELDLQNYISAKSARKLGLDIEKGVLPINDTAERIVKSGAADFGLAGHFSWIDAIENNFNEPLRLEEAVDTVRWEKADEYCEGYYFSIEVVLAFIIKINSVERWHQLDPERGVARLKALLNGLKSVVNLQK